MARGSAGSPLPEPVTANVVEEEREATPDEVAELEAAAARAGFELRPRYIPAPGAITGIQSMSDGDRDAALGDAATIRCPACNGWHSRRDRCMVGEIAAGAVRHCPSCGGVHAGPECGQTLGGY